MEQPAGGREPEPRRDSRTDIVTDTSERTVAATDSAAVLSTKKETVTQPAASSSSSSGCSDDGPIALSEFVRETL